MAIDDMIEQWTTWFQTKAITYSLITWHWVTWAAARGVELTKKTIKGIRDAHVSENWYFRARNECPWPIKENHLLNNLSTEAVWFPENQRMYFKENNRAGDEITVHSFSDVVTAELYNSDKSLQYDLSSFFHTFSWRSARAAPSLYEVVLLYSLTNNLFFSKSQLEGFTLEVLNAEGETVLLRLENTHAQREFHGWNTLHGGTPSAVGPHSDSEAD